MSRGGEHQGCVEVSTDNSGRLTQDTVAPACAPAGAWRRESAASLSGAAGDPRGMTGTVQGFSSQGQGACNGKGGQAIKKGGDVASVREAPGTAPTANIAREAPEGAHSRDPAVTIKAAAHVASAALAAGAAALAEDWPGRQAAAKEAAAILAEGRAEATTLAKRVAPTTVWPGNPRCACLNPRCRYQAHTEKTAACHFYGYCCGACRLKHAQTKYCKDSHGPACQHLLVDTRALEETGEAQ